MEINSVRLSDLVSDPNNARKHDEKNLEAIKGSLTQFGQRKPIVVQGNVVIAGNGTLEAARQLGWDEIDIVQVPEDWTKDQAKAFALADNRTAELASWDEMVLAAQVIELKEAGIEVADFGFVEIDSLNDDAGKDDIEEPEEIPARTQIGNIWQIGQHRIMCGDSFSEANIDRLLNGKKPNVILTDPPYGIDLDTDYSAGGGKKYKKVLNDDVAFDARFYRVKFEYVAEQFWWGANYFQRSLLSHDLEGSWLIWDKRNDNTDSVVGSGFEMCWSATKHKQDLLRYLWTNFTSHVNDGHKRMHPTEKPVPMLIEILERWSKPEDIVIDFFAGSGSTLLAAARTGRIGYGIELDPHYVDQIVARLEINTGQKAELVNV